MVLAIDTVPPKISPSLPIKVLVLSDTNPEVLPPNEQMEDLYSQNTEKKSRLEQALKILRSNQVLVKLNDEFNESVLMKFKRDLKDNQKEAVKFITDYFDDILKDKVPATNLINLNKF